MGVKNWLNAKSGGVLVELVNTPVKNFWRILLKYGLKYCFKSLPYTDKELHFFVGIVKFYNFSNFKLVFDYNIYTIHKK
jgi:hypothetical protein